MTPLGKAEPFRTSSGRAASDCIAGSADVSSALSAERELGEYHPLQGCGMIFPIGSGGLATTAYSLAALRAANLRAANFLDNSILASTGVSPL